MTSRLRRVFAARPVVSRFGLQYRLCEVGPKRLDHQQFAWEIAELLTNGVIREPSPQIITSTNAEEEISLELAHARQTLTSWRAADHVRTTDELVESVFNRLASAGFSTSKLGAAPKPFTESDPGRSGRSHYVDLNSPRTAATLLVTWHEEALSPTDPELWRFIEHCASRDRVPMILARAVSRITFPLLRVLGAKALQYYFIPTIASSVDALAELQDNADRLGLPPAREARTWGSHPVLEVLMGQLEGSIAAPFGNVQARKAITLAVRRAFAEKPPSPAMLRRWAGDIEKELQISMPEPWKRSLALWIKRTDAQSMKKAVVDSDLVPMMQLARAEGTSTADANHPASTEPPMEMAISSHSVGKRRIGIPADVDAATFYRLAKEAGLREETGPTEYRREREPR